MVAADKEVSRGYEDRLGPCWAARMRGLILYQQMGNAAKL